MENYKFDNIISCEQIGEFEDEYVYDIEMEDPTHTFIANDILVHNSLYTEYSSLLDTIEGIEEKTPEEKMNIILKINLDFLDQHNNEYIKEYYKQRHANSIHKFELETIAKSGVWINVKKRYAQQLMWKDGKTFDIDELPIKVKGLEIIKSSYPKLARAMLKQLTKILLSEDNDEKLIHKLNISMMKMKDEWHSADIEEICGSVGVNNYNKYIISDSGSILEFTKGCPSNVKALGNYNQIRQWNHLPGDPIQGGKIKYYKFFRKGRSRKSEPEVFGFQSKNYPKWANEYAPCDRGVMFQSFVLDPINRILEAINFPILKIDGCLSFSLF